jgi:hypothetical protein
MRHLFLLLIVLSMVASSAGCAQVGACPEGEVMVDGDCVPDGPTTTKTISVGCRNSLTEALSILDWDLTVSTLAIESGKPFLAALEGVAVFDESFLDSAQDSLPGGVEEVNLVALNATVQVRSGATGDDVILSVEEVPYRCDEDRAACDPANDLPSVPGARGNTDCIPENDFNPCGRFIRLPTSSDCELCASLGKSGQCSNNGFCITGDLRLDLERESREYTADSQGNVLFGWAEGAAIEEMPVFEDPIGPVGFRLGVGAVPVALECVMPLETPPSALIALPIQTP